VTWSQRLLSVAFITTGVLHFLRPQYYEQILPGYLPAHRELVLVSGAAEIAGGAGLLFAPTRRAAGVWLAAVLAGVFPANIAMAQHPERHRSIPGALLWARLALQPLLVAWTLYATRRES